jgi:oxalate decarboxylase
MSDLSFQNNVPDPVLSGKELPTFKFELEKSAGKVMGNSFGKEATVEQLPISKESPVYQCNSNPA